MSRLAACLLAACVISPAVSASETTGQGISLRHGLVPGTLAGYTLSVRTLRVRRGPAEHTQLEQVQRGRLVQYMLGSEGGRARRVQMLTLQPSEVRHFARDGFAVIPPPEAASLGLDAGGAYMSIDEPTPTTSPPLVPAERIGAFVLFSNLLAWPSEDVATGQRWSKPIKHDRLSGLMTWSLTQLDDGPAQKTATISARFEPASGSGGRSVRFDSATGELSWDLAAGNLRRLSMRADCLVRHPEFDDDYEIHLTVVRDELKLLSEVGQRQAREALAELADAVAAEKKGSRKAALAKARAFLEHWPETPWRPVAEQLVARLTPKPTKPAQSGEVADKRELQQKLTAAVERWQNATREQDEQYLGVLRRWFEETVAANRDRVVSFLSAPEPGPRAVAVFALSFSKDDLDLVALQTATGDADARVRAWAAYGLATRADPRTEFRTLRLLAGDEDARVRARACEAVAACVRPGSPKARKARLLLLANLKDDYDGVRYQAALALTHFAKPADLSRIEAVRKVETTVAVREILDRLARTLDESKPQ